MNQRWTLHVENFARIKEADIEISPLMCFIGDNNSGKSYMMSLLWGLLSSGEVMLNKSHIDKFSTSTINFLDEWLDSNIGKEIILNNEIQKEYVKWFNELLGECKLDLVRHIFNYDIEIDKLIISNFETKNEIVINVNFDNDMFDLEFKINGDLSFGLHSFSGERKKLIRQLNFLISWNLLTRGLTAPLPPAHIVDYPVYLPASRTGFILTYTNIASSAIKTVFSKKSPPDLTETLTLPYINFLQNLIMLKVLKNPLPGRKDHLLDFLKKYLIKGEVSLKEDIGVIKYKPNDIENELSMSVTSSVVTEIAAIYLILNSHHNCPLFIIEEIEAHLHPELQKRIAQFTIRLIHSGINVWITTHSDTILQHFNNMIKLYNRSEQERDELLKQFNYTKDDLLSPDEIKLYQFTREKNFTIIEEPPLKKYGFVVHSFNKAIDELSKEIFAFQEDD